MTRLSIEASFSWAQRVIAREWALLLSVALAFITFPAFAVAILTPARLQVQMQAMASPGTEAQAVQAAELMQGALPWLMPTMLALLLCYGVGSLTITALALKPRISVGEAIVLAVRRLPVLAGSVVLLSAGLFLFGIAETLLLQLAGLRGAQLQAGVLTFLMAAAFALIVRNSPLVGLIVDRRVGPIDAIGETWRLGRGAGWKMLLGLFLYYAGATLVWLALGTALGALVLAGARLGGWLDVGLQLVLLIDRTLSALVMTGGYVLSASFYRQLAGGNRDV